MLTDTQIKKMKLPEGKPIDLLVGGCPSLRLVMRKGSKGNVSRTFYLKYRRANGTFRYAREAAH